MSTPKLRLLLDESITNPLARGIQRLCKSAVYARTNQNLKGRLDSEIAAVANRDKRILVALDSDFMGIRLDAGLITLSAGRLDEQCLIKIFRAFWISGHRSKAKYKKTFLTNRGIRITNGETFRHDWHPHPCGLDISGQ
jgi:predicted nuclease of predicted toxin-antitoxin system